MAAGALESSSRSTLALSPQPQAHLSPNVRDLVAAALEQAADQQQGQQQGTKQYSWQRLSQNNGRELLEEYRTIRLNARDRRYEWQQERQVLHLLPSGVSQRIIAGADMLLYRTSCTVPESNCVKAERLSTSEDPAAPSAAPRTAPHTPTQLSEAAGCLGVARMVERGSQDVGSSQRTAGRQCQCDGAATG